MSEVSAEKIQALVDAARQWQRGDKDAVDRVKGSILMRHQWSVWSGLIKQDSTEDELRDAAKRGLETPLDTEER